MVKLPLLRLKDIAMKMLRFRYRNDAPSYGWLHEDTVGYINGDPYLNYRRVEATMPLNQVKILAPVSPGKIIGITNNYLSGQPQLDQSITDIPELFQKPISSIIGTNQTVLIPRQVNKISFSAELGVIIGKATRWTPVAEIKDHIFGYTGVLNFTAPELSPTSSHGNLTRTFGFDTFCPVGPYIATDINANDLLISSYLNHQLVGMLTTHEMVFNIAQIIAFISTIMTLLPGDLILTGGLMYQGNLQPRDRVEMEIQEIGRLSVQIEKELPANI